MALTLQRRFKLLTAVGLACLAMLPPGRTVAQVWGSNTGPNGGAIYDLVADPTRPGTVYALGSNEFHRSTDGGQSWHVPASSGLGSYGFMVVDPTRGGRLVVATAGGVYGSSDAGDSWVQLSTLALGAIAVDSATGRLYAGRRFGASNPKTIWRSDDGGANWTQVHELRSFSFIGSDWGRAIEVDPLVPGVIYIVTGFGWLVASTDGGDTWADRADLDRIYRGGDNGLPFVGLALDPVVPGLMYMAFNDRVYRSRNSGRSWSNAYKGLDTGDWIESIAAVPGTSGSLYVGLRYSGIYRTQNAGAYWTRASAGLPSLPGALWLGAPGLLATDPTAPPRTYFSTQEYGVFAQVCGNGQMDLGETCDDGNLLDGDGCSSMCRGEYFLSKDEQRCVRGMGPRANTLAARQLADNLRCFDTGAAGTETDPQACLSADQLGRVAAARAALLNAEPRLCTATPPYGYTSGAIAAAAASADAAALVNDLFGPNLTAAQIDPDIDPVGAACQRAALEAAQGLLKAHLTTFLACKKTRIKSTRWPRVGAPQDLADCLWEDHPRLSKAGGKLADVLNGNVCGGVDFPTAFPNGLIHPGTAVRCRACRMVNHIDGLAAECDVFDGAEVGSCP